MFYEADFLNNDLKISEVYHKEAQSLSVMKEGK